MAENLRRAGCVPIRVLAALLTVEPHRFGGKASAGLRGHGMEEAHHRRGHATAVAIQVGGGQPKGKAVWGRCTRRMENVGLRARTLHETVNWLVITDCYNAFNAVKRTAVLAEVPTACQRSRR